MKEDYTIRDNKVIIKIEGFICNTPEKLISSKLFKEIVSLSITNLIDKKSIILNMFDSAEITNAEIEKLISILKYLTILKIEDAVKMVPNSLCFLKNLDILFDYVEFLYNFWRSFERFIISVSNDLVRFEERPYRTFNSTVEMLTHLIRQTYRDIQENISDEHPNVYRQIRAGAQFAVISAKKTIPMPLKYQKILENISIVRQLLVNPPIVLDPPKNKRKGTFIKVEQDLIKLFNIDEREWICYPAKVGELVIMTYIHESFYELGMCLANLFEIASDEELTKKPDGIFLYGVPEKSLDNLGEWTTVFFDDIENDILIGAVPRDKEYGYFGYLKKMMLTLHNVKMLKEERMPFHGSLTEIHLKSNKVFNILLMGDSGTGKSETLEALRSIGNDIISDIIVIADDMGSLSIDDNGEIQGYGTEIGAFLRLDDLKPSTSFGAIDRAIFMSVDKVNSRIVIPITSLKNVLKGVKIDFVLYANNYEEVDDKHSIIEQFNTADEAIKIFREGSAMSKGTTSSTGLVKTYFVNPFGVSSYIQIHDTIADKFFAQMFKKNVFVGQFRTRLGIKGMEMDGPLKAAKKLIELIEKL